MSSILLDGTLARTWRIARVERPTLITEPFEPVDPAKRTVLEEEGERLLAFAAGVEGEIVVRAPTS
jgi:hypothetical protein